MEPYSPAELWMLWIDGEMGCAGTFVVAMDDHPGAVNYLACMNESDARVAADYQNELYDFDCYPVRVK
jgi:hypothetical protein